MLKKLLLSSIVLVAVLSLRNTPAQAATLNLVTGQSTVKIGDTVTVDVKIDSPDVAVNAVQATVQFPKDILSVTNLDYSSSVFSFWLQKPAYSNENGEVTFIGGSTEGFVGQSLQVLRINFKVVGTGQAPINFTDAAVTASNGSGSNILSAMNGVNIVSSAAAGTNQATAPPTQITRTASPALNLPAAPVVKIPLYPNNGGWYNISGNFIAQWKLPNDVTAVAASLNKDPVSNPTVSAGLFDNETFPPLTNGVWYLHVRFKNSNGWGPTVDYKIGIDTDPPAQFGIKVNGGVTTILLSPTIGYGATDSISGIARYSISVDGFPVTSTNATTFTLPQQTPGWHTVTVVAYDQAGNGTEKSVKINILEVPFLTIGSLELTQFWFFIDLFIILAILTLALHMRLIRRLIVRSRK